MTFSTLLSNFLARGKKETTSALDTMIEWHNEEMKKEFQTWYDDPIDAALSNHRWKVHKEARDRLLRLKTS